MPESDIYLYGQTLITHSFLLASPFPQPDGYGEIARKYALTGGETGTCATILDSLGCATRVQGCHLGRNTRGPILDFYRDKRVDLSRMTYADDWDGLEDYVVIDKDTRTIFGQFGAFEHGPVKRWDYPTAQDVAGCRVAAIDPFLQDGTARAAEVCAAAGLPYVTLDCRHDSFLAAHSAVNVLSGGFLRGNYPDAAREALLRLYTAQSTGLVVFTSGAGEILYGRGDGPIERFAPYQVPVESTLGAGDSFKAGCVYALYKGFDDRETVAFASACAAAACMRFPIPLNPPTRARIEEILRSRP